MGGSESARQCLLVEWYQPDLIESAIDAVIDRLTAAATAAQVKLLVALSAPTDETLFGVFAADSVDAVVTVRRQAGWRIDRLTAGVRARMGPRSSGRTVLDSVNHWWLQSRRLFWGRLERPA